MTTRSPNPRDEFPTVVRWLPDDERDHPLVFSATWWTGRQLVLSLETLLSGLEAAAPGRIDGKRRDFRALRQGRELWSAYVELLFAGRLARAGVGFDFGQSGQPMPDLVLASGLGVEITTRTASSSRDLAKHIWRSARAAGYSVRLLCDYSSPPFAVRNRVRDELTAAVIDAIAAGESSVHGVVRPATDQYSAITVTVIIDRKRGTPPSVSFRNGPLLTPTFADVEDAVAAAMENERKLKQGRAVPSLLVVDIAGIEGAFLRPTAIWGTRLLGMLKPEHPWVGVAVMLGSWHTTDFRFVLAESPYAALEDLDKLRELETALGLTRFTAGAADP